MMLNELRSPARKRVRRLESLGSSSSQKRTDSNPEDSECPTRLADGIRVSVENCVETEQQLTSSQTELEISLPPVKTDKGAIDEYEASRAVEQDAQCSPLQDRYDKRSWVKGKSSIYVDAFNLALECVLKDEAHLFDEAEMALFDQWNGLTYESQYL
jgi:Fanconi-associated nuclease 1